ncbi:uncharacterized protein LOC128928445 isoform X4 [Callithrix jacchus]
MLTPLDPVSEERRAPSRAKPPRSYSRHLRQRTGVCTEQGLGDITRAPPREKGKLKSPTSHLKSPTGHSPQELFPVTEVEELRMRAKADPRGCQTLMSMESAASPSLLAENRVDWEELMTQDPLR